MLVRQYIDELYERNDLEEEKLLYILDHIQKEEIGYLQKKALQTKEKYYGKKIYLRALIEFTNYCKRECRYCGINRYNTQVERYRLSEEEILKACQRAKELGFHTFVLQGGEDVYFRDEILVDLVKKIKERFPEFALTLSVGERPYESYQKLKEVGVDRFLLRHETIIPEMYKKLHPQSELQTRLDCLESLKSLGYQIGAGFMVGLPGYENKDYVKDLLFLKHLSPHMTGIGPFIPHHDTELRNEKAGSVEKTVIILALVRLLLPKVLLPATTALGTVSEDGRLRGFASGANVVMPNVTPPEFRDKYALYNGKKNTGDEAAEGLRQTCEMILKNNYEVDMGRGDSKVKY